MLIDRSWGCSHDEVHGNGRKSGVRVAGWIYLALALLLMFPGLSAFAQYENGSLVGTIHDASGAEVAGAVVTITNTATAATSTVTTNGSGDYDAPSLRVGIYTISAKASGFADAIAKNITVSVGVRGRIDLTLQVGSAQTTVEVSDVALQIETDSSQRGQTITQYQSAALPLVSRNYSDLLGLITGSRQAPTAATTSSVNSLVRAGAYNINGQRSMFNNFLLDGMDNNAYGESNQGFDNQIIAVPPDSIAQFQVVTNNESAEFGRSSGATINAASASGTNRFHATLYEFIRNTDLNAAGYFKPRTVGNTGNVIPFQKPTFNRNQFGMNVGGPIRKDKLFFFLDYEGFRQTLKPLSVFTLPTQNELNGVLVVPVKNPVTGAIYQANTAIPSTAINPISQQIIGYFKGIPGLPTTGLPTTGLATNDYSKQVPFTDNSDKGDLRLDYQQSASSSWFLRISDRKETGVNYPALPLPLDGQTNGTIRVLDQQVALGNTHLFGSNKILDVRVGLSKTKAGKFSLSIGNNAITIPGLPTNPVVAGGLPSTSITGFTAFGRQSTNPQWQNPALLDPKINFTWVKGNHSLKFGYEYEHVWMAVNDNNPLYGSFSYGGGYSLCTGCAGAASSAVTDNYWADFLFGNTNNYSLANYFVAHLRQTLDSAYAQDDWKVNPKLTLNLGLRWEYGSPYSEQKKFISNFDPTTQTVLTITPGAVQGNGITPYTGGGGVYGNTLVNPDLNDFAPRLGFAYAATSKIAVRGGYGVSYVHYTRAGSGDILAINAPQAQFASVTQPTPNTTNHCSPLPNQNCYATVDQGFPSSLVTTFNPATDNITWVPKNTRDSYVQSYFLSVQQQVAKNTLLDIAYVGNRGLKLQGFLNGNQLNPSVITNGHFTRPFGNWPSDITEATNSFVSRYDALQVRFEQRFVAGLTLLNSFSWSNSLDNASASLEGNSPSPQDANNIKADYGQSDYNLPVANVTSLVYEVPVGHGRRFLSRSNGAVDALIGGWQISGINTMQAGTPFNIGYSPNSANAVSPQISATYRGANEYRPNVVAGQPLIKKTRLSSGYIQYLNLAAFTLPATRSADGTTLLSPFGNASRNPGRTPAFYQTDLALNKKFSTPIESLKVEFRAESYNLFNHTNLYLPGSGLGGTLGATPTSGGQITSTFEPRILQFGLKILY
ncbi:MULTISPECIES: TonB-dependent receptor [Acidobacteriaceae]|uniref:TonB-dependent receptor n=1 Tax=Acidobacteriaceae TaxID=204434 RepID=UPI0020B145B1|nr:MULTISPECIES: TonB-dependent receptor [Acidobacteriaceae]MDW5264640.1 TonB-dependent receptor [Edaphobacter sp.]